MRGKNACVAHIRSGKHTHSRPRGGGKIGVSNALAPLIQIWTQHLGCGSKWPAGPRALSRRIASSIAIAIFPGGVYSVFHIIPLNQVVFPGSRPHRGVKIREHPLPCCSQDEGRERLRGTKLSLCRNALALLCSPAPAHSDSRKGGKMCGKSVRPRDRPSPSVCRRRPPARPG